MRAGHAQDKPWDARTLRATSARVDGSEGSEGKPTHPPTPSRPDTPTPANQGGRA